MQNVAPAVDLFNCRGDALGVIVFVSLCLYKERSENVHEEKMKNGVWNDGLLGTKR